MPSRRLPESGRSLSWRVLCLALILTFPGGALPRPVEDASVEPLAVEDPLEAWFFGDPATSLQVPRSLDALLQGLGPRPPRPAADSAWDAYFAAYGLAPTPQERARIETALLESPALLATLDPLLRDLAHAQAAREAILARFTPDERAGLLRAVTRLTAGETHALTPEDEALLARLDVARLSSAGAALAQDARAAGDALPRALATDDAFAAHVPAGFAEAAAARDALALLRALARSDPSPEPELAWADLAAQLGAPASAARAPPDLADALARAVGPVLAARATPESADDRAALVALADATPALARAAHNLTLRAPGDLDTLAAAPRPLEMLRRSDDAQASLILADLLGPAEGATPASLPDGHARLRAALGLPRDAALDASVRRLEADLGPDLSGALGTLLAALARHHEELGPDAPAVVRAREAAAKAAPLLASDRPLDAAGLAALSASAAAQADLRALTGARIGDVLEATVELQSLSANAPVPLRGILYRDEALVVFGVGDDEISPRHVPSAPVLLVDLGGDDTYTAPVAGVDLPHAQAGVPVDAEVARAAVVVDLAGNDRYVAPQPFTMGASRGLPFLPTLGLLADADGNDAYTGGNGTLGAGVDGFGILLDRRGDDAYDAVAGLGLAAARYAGSMAAGILVDATGADAYRTEQGFAHLRNESRSPVAAAAFVDVAGPDRYLGDCVRDRPCFATPRLTDPAETPGIVLFVDGGGENTWPRGATPPGQAVESPGSVDDRNVFNGTRVVVIQNGGVVSDADGDFLIDQAETGPVAQRLGLDPKNATLSDMELRDLDGDGWADYLERILLTKPDDPDSAPANLPRPPAPAPNPYDTLPDRGRGVPGRPSSSNFLVNLPEVLAIGLPGPTTYREGYALTLDLGLASTVTGSANDRYFGETATNGSTIDLGGDDLYAPLPYENGLQRRLAWSSTVPSLLLDLAGNDHYATERDGMARAGGAGTPTALPSLAILLDVGGDDTYYAPRGQAQAYATGRGQAFLVDLDGDDAYTSASQGAAAGNASVAVFLDAGGKDAYLRTLADVTGWSDHQGVVLQDTSIAPAGVAAFFDLQGRDDYRATDGKVTTEAPERNNRMRARPLDDPRGGGAAVFLDTSLLRGAGPDDSDNDGAGDAEETVAGTGASNATHRPTGTPGYLLDLPRLGVGIATAEWNRHERDYALLVDLGGLDTYANHAGASTPLFPTALAMDHGEDADRYEAPPSVNLSSFLFSKTGGPGSAADVTMVPGVPAEVGDASDATLAVAQGAGVFGVGILMDGGGQNDFEATVSSTLCDTCPQRAIAFGVAQGAGVGGFGLLHVRGGATAASNGFLVNAHANTTNPQARAPGAIARGVGQGAGVFGVGILSLEHHAGTDTYEIVATAIGPMNVSASAGQGFALRGVGVLLDQGGDSTLLASTLAQGAADDDNLTTPVPRLLAHGGLWPSDHFLTRTRGAVGALLLAGVGNDNLSAERRAQAYAGSGGVGLLLDADGDDLRVLTSPENASGQAAAYFGGAAYLIDNRGNDRSLAAGPYAQAFAMDAVAVHADLSGADAYQSPGWAQAVVLLQDLDLRPTVASAPAATLALFVDRTGYDRYVVTDGTEAQASAVRGKRTVATQANPAIAVFVDGGGFDDYQGRPANQTLKRPGTGNSQRWDTSANGLSAHGVDDDTIGGAFFAVADRLAPFGVGARLTALDAVDPTQPWNGTGPTRLQATLTAGSARPDAVVNSFDRADFLYENRTLGSGSRMGGHFAFHWDTTERVGHRPAFPDGRHEVQALLYPRAGTPVAADGSNRRVATDAQPLPARAMVSIDNPPVAQPPLVPQDLSVAWSPVPLTMWIDRDLERGPSSCPLCTRTIDPAVDEWTLPHEVPAFAPTLHTCQTPDCVPTLTVASGDARAHLVWTPPAAQRTDVLAYLVERRVENDTALLARVHASLGPRFRDAESPADAEYRVGAVRKAPHGEAVAWSAWAAHEPAPTVGPVGGLRAVGAENAIRLAWRPVTGAEAYEVQRSVGGAFSTLDWVTDTTFVDEVEGSTLPDVRYHYRVVPWRHGLASDVPATAVSATASPGARVSIWLDGEANVTVAEAEPLGGGQFQTILWDAAGAPEGRYDARVVLEDESGQASNVTFPLTIDRLPPEVAILLPPVAGRDYLVPGGIQVPVQVVDLVSEPHSVAAMARVDGGAWRSLGEVLPSNLTGANGTHLVAFVLPGVNDGQVAEVVAVAMDRAGNVAGLPPRPAPGTIEAGLAEAAARGGTTVRFDFLPPILRATPLDAWVQPNHTVTITAVAADTGTGLRDVRARVGSTILPLASSATPGLFTGTLVARDVGRHQVVVEAEDNGGNVARAAAGVLFVDDAPPRLEEASIGFSGGRVVGTPGELARIVVRATDASSAPETLRVTLEAGNVASRGTIAVPWSAAAHAHQAEFPVDRVQPLSESVVTLRVADLAGNVAELSLPVRIDAVPVGFASPVSVEAHADRAWFNWTTERPGRGRVDHGLGPQLGSATSLGPSDTNHSILVTGLTPATRQYAKAVVVTDAGIEKASPLLEFTTLPGLQVTLAPLSGFPYARDGGRLHLEAWTHDGRAANVSAEIFLVPPRGSPTLVAEVAQPGDVDVELTPFRDGTYGLVARAKGEGLTGQSPPLTVVLDRAAPILDLATEATILPGKPLVLLALERGSGIDMSKLTITVDGVPCVASLRDDRLTCLAPDVKAPQVELNVSVADRAGNVGSLRASLPAVSRETALLRVATLRGETGTEFVRPGRAVTLVVEADPVGIERVLADLRALGGDAEQEVHASARGRYQFTFTVPDGVRAGPVVVPVVAYDKADQPRHLVAGGFVDDAPPRAESVEILPGDGPGGVAVRVLANEPVRLRVEAPGARAERAEAAAQTQVTLTGLRPGRPFQAILTLTDRAGNAATVTAEGVAPADHKPPNMVADLRAVDLGDGRVVLLWTPASDNVGVDAYRVYLREGTTLRLVAEPTDPRAEVEVPPGVRVDFVVKAIDLGGNEGDGVAVEARSVPVPRLADGRVDPPLGGPGLYEFRVNVTQRSGGAPAVNVLVDGRPVRMTPEDSDCTDGCTYRAVVSMGPQPLEGDGHRFSFVAHHEGVSVRLPEGGRTLAGPVVVGQEASSVLQGASRVPAFPLVGLAGVVALAAGLVAWRTLRRKS